MCMCMCALGFMLFRNMLKPVLSVFVTHTHTHTKDSIRFLKFHTFKPIEHKKARFSFGHFVFDV